MRSRQISVRGASLVLIALFLMLSVPLCAQNSDAAGPATSAAQNSEASNQESREDETAQFKYSGSVRLLSRITGLSEEGAYWLAVVLNFAIVVGLIAWFWKKNVPALFRNRTASIQKSIEEAGRASEDANRRLADIESRLGRLDEEINRMRAISEQESAAEEARIRAAAEEDAKRIVQSAEQEIAASAKAARRELTAYAADLAISLAAKQIRVDTPSDQALVRRFARQLSNGSASGNTS
jgi:F-type H+-transporting ATPase subunit b